MKTGKWILIFILTFSMVGCKKSVGQIESDNIEANSRTHKNSNAVMYSFQDWTIQVLFTNKELKSITLNYYHNDGVLDYSINYPVMNKRVVEGTLVSGKINQEKEDTLTILNRALTKLGCSIDLFIDYSDWYFHNSNIGSDDDVHPNEE